MVFLPVVLPPASTRWLHILPADLYAAIVAVTIPGSWAFYLFFSAIETNAEHGHGMAGVALAKSQMMSAIELPDPVPLWMPH